MNEGAQMNAAPERRAGQRSESFRRIVWRRYRKDAFAMGGLFFIILLFVVSLLAPLLANNRPIIYIEEGTWYFPALADHKNLAHMRWKWGTVRDNRLPPNTRAFFPPVPFGPEEQSLHEGFQAPSRRHLFGTDALGIDVLSRMIHGAGVSLKIGFVAMGIAVIIGILMGAPAGYYGGKVDMIISRIIEVVICFPTFWWTRLTPSYVPDVLAS